MMLYPVGLKPDPPPSCGSAFRPTSGDRSQRTEDSRVGDSRGGASSAGERLSCVGHLSLWVGLQPDGVRADAKKMRRPEGRPTGL